jgi:hypothetical protein
MAHTRLVGRMGQMLRLQLFGKIDRSQLNLGAVFLCFHLLI